MEMNSNEASHSFLGGNKKRRVGGDSMGVVREEGTEEAEEEQEPVAILLFPQVVKQVTQTNFLTTKELGCLLLLTSKSMTGSAFDGDNDCVWKCLCFTRWGINDTMNLIEQTGMSAEEVFRALTTRKNTFTGPRSLQYSPEDYVVIVTVRETLGDKHMFCKTIQGQDLSGFFETGEAQVLVEKPLWKHAFNETEENVLLFEWEAKVHMMRLPDQRVVEIANFRQEDLVDGTFDEGGMVDVEPGLGECTSYPSLNAYGRAMIRHYFPSWNTYQVEVELDYGMISTKSVAIFGFGLRASFVANHLDGEEIGNVDVSELVEHRKEITFAHFLEALNEWDA